MVTQISSEMKQARFNGVTKGTHETAQSNGVIEEVLALAWPDGAIGRAIELAWANGIGRVFEMTGDDRMTRVP